MKAPRQLPVFDTAAAAFVFAWRERGTIIRLSWFPLLVSTLAGHFAPDDSPITGVWLLTIAAWAVIAVSLHRVILFGDRQPTTWLNIRFGKPEALFALVPVLCIATIVVLEKLGVSTDIHLTGNAAIVAMIIMAVVIFFLVRFCLVFPIAVIERRIDFAQAWALSHGDVWRMIGVWLVVTIPPYMVLDALRSALLWLLNYKPIATAVFAGSPPDPGQFEGSLLELAVLTYPFSIVLGALCVGILSFSYKALAGFAPDAVLKLKGP